MLTKEDEELIADYAESQEEFERGKKEVDDYIHSRLGWMLFYAVGVVVSFIFFGTGFSLASVIAGCVVWFLLSKSQIDDLIEMANDPNYQEYQRSLEAVEEANKELDKASEEARKTVDEINSEFNFSALDRDKEKR